MSTRTYTVEVEVEVEMTSPYVSMQEPSMNDPGSPAEGPEFEVVSYTVDGVTYTPLGRQTVVMDNKTAKTLTIESIVEIAVVSSIDARAFEQATDDGWKDD